MLHWIVSPNAKRSQLQFHAFRLCLAEHNINIVNRGSRNKTKNQKQVLAIKIFLFEQKPAAGFELATFRLQVGCTTTVLCWQV